MSRLEDQLRAALGRKAPSQDFARRVLEHAQSNVRMGAVPRLSPTGPRFVRPAKPRLRAAGIHWAAAIAAAIVLIVAGALHEVRVRQQRAQAELAGQQAQIALRIASAKLNVALRQIQRLNEGSRVQRTAKRSVHGAEEL